MNDLIHFPTALHKQAAETVATFCQTLPTIDAVLIVNSIARGQGTSQSDLDIAVLVPTAVLIDERTELEARWQAFYRSDATLQRFSSSGPFAHIHLDFVDGTFTAETWDDGGGPDAFEIEIGNLLFYSVAMWEATAALSELRGRWLPYYSEPLRQERLQMVAHACRYDLDHIPFFVQRGLYFQAFDRLYKAYFEFLQALFIAHRTYPIAYNKWIREQIEIRLGLPALYTQLPAVLQVPHLEGEGLLDNAAHLRNLLGTWAL
jgi:predicted nucleotidyltransferase